MSINELKEIVENAPEGATHYGNGMYYNFTCDYAESAPNKKYSMECIDYEESELEPLRSLEDIRTIIELYEGLQNAIEACYDLDSFGVRETNSDYINAYKLLERFE